jgi:hypothetical protein
VYGVDSRDIWVFDGQGFTGLGNQRVKNFFFEQVDPRYTDRVFMIMNTQKSQVEIYYPTIDALNGLPDRMISYRTDLQVWNPPRQIYNATFACESPVWLGEINTYTNLSTTNIVSSGVDARFTVNMEGTQYATVVTTPGTGYAVGNTIKIVGTAVGGSNPANDYIIFLLFLVRSDGIVVE